MICPGDLVLSANDDIGIVIHVSTDPKKRYPIYVLWSNSEARDEFIDAMDPNELWPVSNDTQSVLPR